MTLFDAHNHLHDARLARHRGEISRLLGNVSRCVVNGTCEDDWPAVARLAADDATVLPSFGLHPWHVARRSPHWLENLVRQLEARSDASIGEIGLDRWIEGHDLELQSSILADQLALAATRNLSATIHCVRAWGALWDLLHSRPLPARGFLLHAYGGPMEMVNGWAESGAYFSFNAAFLHERKRAQRECFRHLPLDRLLVETDAPDMLPPASLHPYPLPSADGELLNHPANLALAYAALADLRGLRIEALAEQVAENFARLFLHRPPEQRPES